MNISDADIERVLSGETFEIGIHAGQQALEAAVRTCKVLSGPQIMIATLVALTVVQKKVESLYEFDPMIAELQKIIAETYDTAFEMGKWRETNG
jgi:hypothetical protein